MQQKEPTMKTLVILALILTAPCAFADSDTDCYRIGDQLHCTTTDQPVYHKSKPQSPVDNDWIDDLDRQSRQDYRELRSDMRSLQRDLDELAQ